jgi:hypothetical protein
MHCTAWGAFFFKKELSSFGATVGGKRKKSGEAQGENSSNRFPSDYFLAQVEEHSVTKEKEEGLDFFMYSIEGIPRVC